MITARPSWGRIQTGLTALMARGHRVNLIALASALLPRYGRIDQQMRNEGWAVRGMYTLVEGDSGSAMAKTTALSLIDLATALDQQRPDAVITVADRYETIATAIAASYQDVPLIHVQGGESTGSIDDRVRHAVTMLADYHAVATDGAGQRLRGFGVAPERIAVTGCPSVDLAAQVMANPGPLPELPGIGPDVDVSSAIVVLFHPVTDEAGEAGAQAQAVLEAVEADGRPVIWFWPNVDHGTDAISKVLRVAHERGSRIRFVRHLPSAQFLRLLLACQVLVGNSSVGIRECSYLGVRVVNVGTRQQGRERGPNVVDVWPSAVSLAHGLQAWRLLQKPEPSTLYGDGQAGARFAQEVDRWLSR